MEKQHKHRVLIVDDDAMTRKTLAMALEDRFETRTAADGREALALLAGQKFDLVLSDLDMPQMDGITLLEKLNELEAGLPVIFITGQGTIETAVKAMKLGAYDYVSKPVNLDRLELLIDKAIETSRLKEENILLKEQIASNRPDLGLIAEAPAMKKTVEQALKVADSRATVLIEGESGTGKEMITNLIHYNSPVANGPFIKVNCSAFAEGVLESELFGHEKGAFTGANASRKGRFELADHGTLFLDEIGEMPAAVQVKLLRFLQERTFERVGGNRTIEVDVRIISATNRNLEQMVREGRFREDLFYRLRVIKIEVPPLRERREDIPAMVQAFIMKFSAMHGKKVTGMSTEALEMILAYKWPGNVRELVNCVESAVVMCRGDTIGPEDLPDYLSMPAHGAEGGEGLLAELERKAIAEVMSETDGDKTAAAKRLGIGLRTLYRKLEKYGITAR